MKILDASKVPRIIAHSKKNDAEKKKKLEADDILKYVSLLEGLDMKTVFVVRNLHKVPQIDLGTADLCFLMQTVEDLRKKVLSLIDIKEQLNAVQSMVSGLVATTKPTGLAQNLRPTTQNGNHQLTNSPSSSGLANDTNLRVKISPLQLADQSSSAAGTFSQPASVNRPSYAQAACKPPIVRSKSIDQSFIKVSTKPREFHIH